MKTALCLLLLAVAGSAMADTADEAWAAIGKLRKGPGVPPPGAPEEIVRKARAHLAKQEQALAAFLAAYPADPRRHEAAIELAGVTADIGVSLSDRNRVEKAIRDLAAIERDKSAPAATRADAAFQRITTTMQTVNMASSDRPAETARARNLIHDAAGNFASRYPDDRRAARLLAVAATLFDDLPSRKRRMLEQAAAIAGDQPTQQRIADDIRRLDLLGKEGDISFPTIQGGKFSVAGERGKIVVLIFWAGWSPPSVAALTEIARESRDWPPGSVVMATVSLDEKQSNCTETLRVLGVPGWPTAFTGKVWQDPLARSAGINALPTVFVYDKAGRLRMVNPRQGLRSLVQQLAGEKNQGPPRPVFTR